ncbi:MAG: hypothetical protein LBN10_06375 [Propionibacteriaceae bacterium]|jgi:hypothetical protein|nr:hypothetical protein [Propionibacteriaceae bacterium]
MSTQLRLWALSAGEVRQFFLGIPEEMDRLRDVAAPLIPSTPVSRGLLSKIGPLTRKNPPMPVITPGVPNRMDVEALLSGRFTATDRLSASWAILCAWLDASALAHADIGLTPAELETLDFDLGRAGIPYDVGIRRLWGRSLDIPLRPCDSHAAGYLPYRLVATLNQTWAENAEELEESSRPFVTSVMAFTQHFSQYADQAASDGREAPDLIAWWSPS